MVWIRRLIATSTARFSIDDTRVERRRTEICQLHYKVTVTETSGGCRLRIEANGTDEVPLRFALNPRDGVAISGAEKIGRFKDAGC